MNIKNLSTKILLNEAKKRISENYYSDAVNYSPNDQVFIQEEVDQALLDEVLSDKDTYSLIYNEYTRGGGRMAAVQVLLDILDREGMSREMSYKEAGEHVAAILLDMGIIFEAKRKKRKKKSSRKEGNYPFGIVGGWRYWDGYDRGEHTKDIEETSWDFGGGFDGGFDGGFGDGGGGE